MSDASARVENGPTDLPPDELAERKRVAAIDYYQRELGELKAGLERLQAKKGVDKDKVANQKRKIAAASSALTAAEGA